MKAVVLVGGEGTRMRPLTETIPKPLLPVMGRPFLHHVLDHLVVHGVHEVVLSSPYLESRFAEFLAERAGDPDVTWITEPEPLGTGGAVLNALGVGKDPFFVLNGDILTDLDLSAMYREFVRRRSAVAISTFHVDDARPFGLIVTDEADRILEFREKPSEPIPGDVNAGTYLIDPAALEGFARGPASIEREVFPALIERGVPLHAFAADCYWMDLGTPQKYLQAHFDILEGRVGFEMDFPAPFVHPGAHVDSRAQLGRWVVALDEVRVDLGAEVEDSVLLERAWVHAGAKVRGSVLGPGSVVGADAQVEDSVLGEGAVVAPGETVDGMKVSRPAGDHVAD